MSKVTKEVLIDDLTEEEIEFSAWRLSTGDEEWDFKSLTNLSMFVLTKGEKLGFSRDDYIATSPCVVLA